MASDQKESAVCMIAKNEGPYLLEWVAYHKTIGFDHVYIYDNGSTDGTEEILTPLHRSGIIEYIPWPDRADETRGPQSLAYNDCLRRSSTDWLAFIDADEFICLKQHRTVGDFLSAFPPHVGLVALSWRIFGSSGHVDAGEEPVLERFTRASRLDHPANRNVKSIVRTEKAVHAHVHICSIENGINVNSDGALIHSFENGGLSPAPAHSVAQVNHYVVKSRSEYEAKRRRGDATVAAADPRKYGKLTEEFFQRLDLNDEEDLTILSRLHDTIILMNEYRETLGLDCLT